MDGREIEELRAKADEGLSGFVSLAVSELEGRNPEQPRLKPYREAEAGLRAYHAALESQIAALAAENARLRTDYQVMKAALDRCKDEILSNPSASTAGSREPAFMQSGDRLGTVFSATDTNDSLLRVEELSDVPLSGDVSVRPEKIEAESHVILQSGGFDHGKFLQGGSVEATVTGAGRHAAPAVGESQAHCRTPAPTLERGEVLAAVRETAGSVTAYLCEQVTKRTPAHDKITRAIAEAKKHWQEDAVRIFRDRLLARLQTDFEQN